MRRVGGAAAVAEDEDLPVFLERHAQRLDKLRHRLDGDRIVRCFLALNVVANPLFHAVHNPPSARFCQADSGPSTFGPVLLSIIIGAACADLLCVVHSAICNWLSAIIGCGYAALRSCARSQAVPKTEGREDSLNSRRAALREKHLLGFRPSDFRLRTSAFGLRTSDFRLRTSSFKPAVHD